MKILFVIFVALSLSACETRYIKYTTIEVAVAKCRENGGLKYLSFSETADKKTMTPRNIKAHCNNSAMFIIKHHDTVRADQEGE